MKNIIIASLIMGLFSATALASAKRPVPGKRGPAKRAKRFKHGTRRAKRGFSVRRLLYGQTPACKALKVTAKQKSLIKLSVLDAKSDSATLRADLIKAKVAFRKLVLADATTLGDANSQTKLIVDASADLQQVRLDLKSKVLFGILSADQRKLAGKCVRSQRRVRRPRPGRRPHPRKRPYPRRPKRPLPKRPIIIR